MSAKRWKVEQGYEARVSPFPLIEVVSAADYDRDVEAARLRCNICEDERGWPHHHDRCAYVANVRDLNDARSQNDCLREEMNNVLDGRDYQYLIEQREKTHAVIDRLVDALRKVDEDAMWFLRGESGLPFDGDTHACLRAIAETANNALRCPECGGQDFTGVSRNGKCADCLWEDHLDGMAHLHPQTEDDILL